MEVLRTEVASAGSRRKVRGVLAHVGTVYVYRVVASVGGRGKASRGVNTRGAWRCNSEGKSRKGKVGREKSEGEVMDVVVVDTVVVAVVV